MTPNDPPQRGNNSQYNNNNAEHQADIILSFAGLAQRAGAILQRMELCTPPLILTRGHHVKNNNNVVFQSEPPVVTSSQPLFTTRDSYQGVVYPDFSPHLLHTKFALPSPTREIYNMVLLSYSKEVGPLHVAQQAEDVIWSMIVRARKHQQQQMLHVSTTKGHEVNEKSTPTSSGISNKRFDILLPSTDNWNCVLKCWSKSTDPHRSFYAYSFLLSWIEWNKQYQSLLLDDGGLENIEDMVYESKPNAESFRIVLQSCLVDMSSQDLEIQRAKHIGSGVAIRLWKEVQRLENDSTTYLMIVRAICQTSELPTTVSTSKALTTLARVYTHCCNDGKLTDEISNLVESATSKSQFAQLQTMVDTTTAASST